MSETAFFNRERTPSIEEIEAILGDAAPLWEVLKEQILDRFPGAFEEWAWSGKKHGWSFRLKLKKRTILYMKPKDGSIGVSFALGGKAIAAAREADLPHEVLDNIYRSPSFPEGKAVRFEVCREEDMPLIGSIAGIKMAN